LPDEKYMRVVCRILGNRATVVASFWPSRALGMSSGFTSLGAWLSLTGSASAVDAVGAWWGSSGTDSTFLAASVSLALRPWVRLLSALQPLLENHLSAKRP
jgi:hypothetical protein